MIHHITRATRHLIFWSLITAAVSLTGLRLVLLEIDNYKSALSSRISELAGLPVKIGRLNAKMRGFNPELILKDITIASAAITHGKPVIQLKEIRLGINLLEMALNRDLLSSSWVTLVGAKLSVIRKPDGSFAIAGLKATDGEPLWLLQGRKYEVLQSEITWLDEKRHGRPLKFESVDMAIINDADRHRINLLMKLPDKYGKALRVSIDVKGNFFQPSTINGDLFIEGDRIKLPEWITVDLPLDLKLNSGTGDLKVWTKLDHSQLVAMNVEAQLQQLKLIRQNHGEFSAQGLKTRFRWAQKDEQWRLDVNELALETAVSQGTSSFFHHFKSGSKKESDAVFSIAANHDRHKLALFIEQLDLQAASHITQFLDVLPEPQSKLLAQAQLTGQLKKVSLFADLEQKAIAVNGRFTGLGMAPLPNIPGFEQVSGRITGSEKQGVLDFVTDNSRFTAPDLFPQPVHIEHFNGRLNWRQTDQEWQVSSRKIVLDLPGFQSKNRFSLTVPKIQAAPFMDMQSAFVSDDVSKLRAYFPTKVMRPQDIDWFGRAFPGGRVVRGGLLYVSRLDRFPAKVEDGIFEILLDIEQLQLAYASDWPLVTDISGKVSVNNNILNCEVYGGLSNRLKIGQATVVNPAMGLSKTLMIKGDLEGKIADVFDFLQQTPLKSRVDVFVNALAPQGNTHVALNLAAPLTDSVAPKVDVIAQLDHAELNVKPVDLSISQIDGELKFTEQGVYSDTIHAIALDQPVKIKLNRSEQQQTVVNVEGSAEVAALQKQFKMPGWEMAKGIMAYQLQLVLPDANSPGNTNSGSELTVHSDLVGIDLLLPGFLAKTASQKRPLSLKFDLGDNASLPIAVNYDDTLKAAIKVGLPQQNLQSGHIVIGSGDAVPSSEAGLLLEINQDQLNLKDWIALAGRQGSDGGNGLTGAIREIKLHGKQAHWQDTPLGRFEMALKPDGDDWSGTVDSVFGAGKFHIPADLKGAEKISLDMTSLDLSALKQMKGQIGGQTSATLSLPETQLSPASLPLLRISSLKTLWQSVDLGRLTLETERLPDGMSFKQIELTGAEQQLSLSGHWKINGRHSQTQLQGHLQMPRAGQLLAELDVTKDLVETSSDADFSVSWNGAPHDFTLEDLRGQIDIRFKEGRILSVEPGFGRILGILALEQWLKRLQLDFRDVYQEGLTFNYIRGHFDLLKGKAVTNNLIVDAIPAKITVTGETDFVNRTVDHLVNVVPKSADAVPIAGTIMGKVTTMITRTLTGKNHDGFFFGSEYRVKGKWENLVVIPLHENDGLFQKTWAGITDFPWLTEQKKQ